MEIHGHCQSLEYRTWTGMKARCHNPKQPTYQRYGARGITVCDRWRHSFIGFLEDMGPKPSSTHSIDRINGTLGYFKENCRWATPKEQAANRKTTFKTQKQREAAHEEVKRKWRQTDGCKAGKKKYYSDSRVCATHSQKPWPTEDVALLFSFPGTDRVLGRLLGRSVQAIQIKRVKVRHWRAA